MLWSMSSHKLHGSGKERLNHRSRKTASMWAIGHLHVNQRYNSVRPHNHIGASPVQSNFVTLPNTSLTIKTFQLKNSVLWPSQRNPLPQATTTWLAKRPLNIGGSTKHTKTPLKPNGSDLQPVPYKSQHELRAALLQSEMLTYRIYRDMPTNGFAAAQKSNFSLM